MWWEKGAEGMIPRPMTPRPMIPPPTLHSIIVMMSFNYICVAESAILFLPTVLLHLITSFFFGLERGGVEIEVSHSDVANSIFRHR